MTRDDKGEDKGEDKGDDKGDEVEQLMQRNKSQKFRYLQACSPASHVPGVIPPLPNFQESLKDPCCVPATSMATRAMSIRCTNSVAIRQAHSALRRPRSDSRAPLKHKTLGVTCCCD